MSDDNSIGMSYCQTGRNIFQAKLSYFILKTNLIDDVLDISADYF